MIVASLVTVNVQVKFFWVFLKEVCVTKCVTKLEFTQTKN